MRTYLVVMDETEEAKQALRFASLRAHKTGGSVHILALVPQQTFNAFGGVQATIEQEARERAEVMARLHEAERKSARGRVRALKNLARRILRRWRFG